MSVMMLRQTGKFASIFLNGPSIPSIRIHTKITYIRHLTCNHTLFVNGTVDMGNLRVDTENV